MDHSGDADAPSAAMRALHTLKGGARLAGAMRLGEMAHGLETSIEALAGRGDVLGSEVEVLLMRADAMSLALEQLRARGAAPSAPAPTTALPAAEVHAAPALPLAELPAIEALPIGPPPAEPPALDVPAIAAPQVQPAASSPVPAAEPSVAPAAQASAPALPVAEPAAPPAPAPAAAPAPVVRVPVAIDWQRFASAEAAPLAAAERPVPASGAVVRVRAGLLDRLVNQAGEVSITRARIDADVRQMQGALGDLTDSLERLRRQLRDIELQAETQISTRIEAAKAASQSFDPLEMDRFTRFQELTRFMAESVNDVATLQRGLQRTLQSTEDELAAQARLTRELQDDLLRTRMVEFESIAERLQRTARQAAKETDRQVRLEIVGGAIEVDRGVLERMAGSFEHLLRNSVAHGIEAPAARQAAGKDSSGLITVTVAQAGNEVGVEFADDGAGLDLARIRRRAVERGLLAEGAPASDAELAQFIFHPGFSTAETVTELAGRGVGLDVVRAEVNAMGGRVETASEAGRGTRFKLLLPLTTAVTQVVMLRCGELQVAVPSTLIEIVRRAPRADVERAYAGGQFEYAGETMPFFWLPALLRAGSHGEIEGRTQTVVVVRSASQRVAVHVDEVVGNQEVVVKNVGPQLSRLPGLAGVTLLPSGAVALIYNPVALASLYGDEARERMRRGATPARPQAAEAAPLRAPMVLVVDDSLTVRRVTQRLLVREGYRVVLAKDGLDALERLAEERPAVLLSDIEMPRMDGFDLVRNVRADPALAGLPVVMITSRIAQKHRDYAAELGVDHYLGKPYAEEELLGLVARYAGADIPA
jgi:chemosensory pili system protein ChpA (sensor histidine kinase/response regulator)